MAPIKTCVLGTGLSGLVFQIPFILALPNLFTLHSVLSLEPKAQTEKILKSRFDFTPSKIYDSLEEVLSDGGEIELVVVATPNATHYEFAKRCLHAGKHVLLEKPVTPSVGEARELGELAREKKVVLYAHQNRRWDSDFNALKRLLSLEDQSVSAPLSLGDVFEFETHFDRFRSDLDGSWRDEKLPAGGLLYDLGIHLIDQVVSLFGKPHKVTGFVENLRGMGHPEVDDTFTIVLRYPASTTARKYPLTVIIRGTLLSVRDPQPRLILRGTKGTFVKYGTDVQETQLLETPRPRNVSDAEFGREPKDIYGEVEVRDEETGKISKHQWPSTDPGSYKELFKNLAGAIRNGEELKVKWEEAITVLEIVEAAHRSSREERTITLG